nr:TetR/AcrR family transcriptional regulator [Rhodococcus sp. (in: high G+C Gram-positive bacteria)]
MNSRTAQVDAARIVDASVEILTDRGLDALSIRSVASHLGLSPMSIYRYVESKSDLLDAVVLRILDRMEIPQSFAEGWSERIVVTMTAWRDLLLANPSVIPILVDRPIPAGSEGLARIEENILANLEVAGITGDAGVQAFWQIFTLTFGQVVFELPRRQLREEDMDDYAASMSSIARERGFVRVRELAPKLVSMKGRGTFEQALFALLRGLQSD